MNATSTPTPTTSSPPSFSPADAATELLARRTARRSLLKFTEIVAPDIVAARHHRLLAERLEAVVRGECKRLMIFMPPGHGKSWWGSVWFAAWYLGNKPSANVICASHTKPLAETFSRRVRRLVDSPECHRVFGGLALDPRTQAATYWETTKGGAYVATGVAGAIQGRRADLAVIDDPIRSRHDADSLTVRDRLWEWYLGDLHIRLRPEASMVLIQTRWHEDDLAGRLLDKMASGGETWDVVSLPAEAEEGDELGREVGEWLWPEWFSEQYYVDEKRTQPPRNWSALFQQSPAPETGAYFEKDWLRYYDTAPARETLRTYGASDYAVTAGGGDYTVHMVFGVDPEDRIFVLDLWRQQTSSDVWVEAAIDLMAKWKPLAWAEEADQIKRSVGPFLLKRMRERRVSCLRRQYPAAGDKAVKAQSIRGRMAMNMVYLPKNAEWMTDLVSELMSFPVGVHDDQVDVLSLLGRMLDRLVAGEAPPKPKPPIEVRPPTLNELIKMQPDQGEGRKRI